MAKTAPEKNLWKRVIKRRNRKPPLNHRKKYTPSQSRSIKNGRA